MTTRKKIQKGLQVILAIEAGLLLLAVGVGLPLFYHDGYVQISSWKYLYFQNTMKLALWCKLPVLVMYGIFAVDKEVLNFKKWKESLGSTRPLTKALILFTVLLTVSYAFAVDRKEALWGTDGWFMGYGTYLCFIACALMIGYFFPYKRLGMGIVAGAGFLVIFWGICNRFSIYPVQMTLSSPEFISSMGNVNWMCGYLSLIVPLIVGIYFGAGTNWQKNLILLPTALSMGFLVIEGSESAFLILVALFMGLFFLAGLDQGLQIRFYEVLVLFFGSTQFFRLWDVVAPEALNKIEPMGQILLGNIGTIGLFLSVLLLIWKPHWGKVFRLMALTLLCVGIALVFSLMVINTSYGGTLFGKGLLYFSDDWGSGRGRIYYDGILVFQHMPFFRKLIGVGPDCFASFAYSQEVISNLFHQQFWEARLTNAHNESITQMVNIGVLGMASFWYLLWSAAKTAKKKASGIIQTQSQEESSDTRVYYGLTLAILCYFVHNMVSFAQIESVPILFLLMGLSFANKQES